MFKNHHSLKDILHPKTVYDILKPLLYITKIFGLTPFSLRGNYYTKNVYSTSYSILVLIFLFSYSTYAVCNLTHSEKDGIIANLTQRLQELLNLTSLGVSLLFGCIHQRKVLHVIQQFHQIDQDYHALEEPINIKKTYKKVMWYVIIATFFLILYVIANVFFDVLAFMKVISVKTVGIMVAFVMPLVSAALVDIQFCVLVLFARRRLQLLNDRLEKGCCIALWDQFKQNCETESLFTTAKSSKLFTPKVMNTFLKEKMRQILEYVRVTHYQLCSICTEINSAYSVQFLMITLQAFATLIATLFAWAQQLMSHQGIGLTTSYMIYSSNTTVFFIFQIILVSTICSKTSNEAHRTGSILHKTLTYTRNMGSEITYFSLQLLHHNVEFSACRIFKINETLMLSVVGAITTYLVIVIQFEMGSKNSPS